MYPLKQDIKFKFLMKFFVSNYLTKINKQKAFNTSG